MNREALDKTYSEIKDFASRHNITIDQATQVYIATMLYEGIGWTGGIMTDMRDMTGWK